MGASLSMPIREIDSSIPTIVVGFVVAAVVTERASRYERDLRRPYPMGDSFSAGGVGFYHEDGGDGQVVDGEVGQAARFGLGGVDGEGEGAEVDQPALVDAGRRPAQRLHLLLEGGGADVQGLEARTERRGQRIAGVPEGD